MESLSLYEIHKVCRICLKNDILVSIYSPTFPIRPIEMLRKLQICKLPIDDNLSTLLCQSCLYRLLDAYNLQQLAESSEQRLKEYLDLTVKLNNTSIATDLPNAINLPDLNETDKEDTRAVSANIYDNIYDIFDRNEVTSNDIVEVVGNDDVDLLNDVEIDVSSLTRSEVDDNTLSDMFMQRNDRLIKYPMESPYLKDTYKIGDIPKHSECKEVLDNEYKSDAHALSQCLECDKLYHYAECSNNYACMHSRENAFKCKICPVELSEAATLQMPERHTLLNDAPLGRRYQCEICAAFFTTSSNLKAHKFTHCEQRNFQCKQCQRSFKSQRDLRRHEPMHKIIKDLICTVCVKAFTKNKYLRAHMLTVHRGVKRHKCSECDKMFGKRSNLICHLRTHTGEKPYHCTICSWKFNQSSALMRHLKKHTKGSLESTEATKTIMTQKSDATASNKGLVIDFSQQG